MIRNYLRNFIDFSRGRHIPVQQEINYKEILFWVLTDFIIGELIFSSILLAFTRAGFLVYKVSSYYGEAFFVFAVLMFAPIAEELIFRAPLKYFVQKKYFIWIVYISTTIFAIIHHSSYEYLDLKYLVIVLSLIGPFYGGLIFSYIRLKFGVSYAILIHFLYNLLSLLWGNLLSI